MLKYTIVRRMKELTLVAVLLYFAYCAGEEPHCSPFHYDEQTLAKVIRLEQRLEQLEAARTNIGGQTANSICPDTWIRFQGSCYLFPRGHVNFSTAEYICAQHGSHLVHIESESENNFLKNHMRDLKDSSYWIGLTKTVKDGPWIWYGTETFALFTDWSSHSPNNYGGNQFCVFMELGHDFQWNDMSCDTKYMAVCEKNLLG